MRKILLTTVCSVALSAVLSFASFAAWQQDGQGWRWQNAGGSFTAGTWQWIDGNGDGTAECYYFDQNGYMAVNTTVDGSEVNESGAWTVDGQVQTKEVKKPSDDPMEGIACSSTWMMLGYTVNDLGDQYEVTGNVYDAQVYGDYSNAVGSDGEPEDYEDMDTGIRRANVTVYVPKGLSVGRWPAGEFWNYTASEADSVSTLLYGNASHPWGMIFTFELNGSTVSSISDCYLNYVS